MLPCPEQRYLNQERLSVARYMLRKNLMGLTDSVADLDDGLIVRFLAAHAAAGCRGPSRLPSVLVPTIAQIVAGRQLVSFLTETVSSIEHIYAHQQVYSHGNRGNCPGPHIWFNVGKWAVDNLGLNSSGALRPIPRTIGRGQIGWEDSRFQLL